MIVALLLLMVISLIGVKVSINYQDDYLSIENTKGIKGIFVGFVLLSHLAQYVILGDSVMDKSFDLIIGLLGQNIVIVFLLYSGYGIGEAIKKKGISYIDRLPKHRILKNWVHFLGGIFLFFLLNVIFVHDEYTGFQYFMSLFALQSIGNSTWFIFAIIICWIFTWIAFKMCRQEYKKSIFLLVVLLVIYIAVISHAKEGHAWYDTVLCYPLGMILSFNIEKVNAFFKSNIKNIVLVIMTSSWVILRLFVGKNIFTYELQSMIFAVFVLAISTRIRFGNKILNWLGNHTFSVYILQRLPMILLSQIGLNETHRAFFVVVSVAITCILAECFDRGFAKIDKILRL